MANNFQNCFAKPRRDFTPYDAELVNQKATFKRRDGARTTEVRLDEPRGVYKGVRVFVFDEVRAPYKTEWRVFNALQALGWFVAICYHQRRALDVIQNYMNLGQGQRFDGGITVFKGRTG